VNLTDYLRNTWPLEGVGPITRAQRERIHEAAATIEALLAEVAGMDAEIARVVEQAATAGYMVCAETRHVTRGDKVREAILATAIASGAYRETGSD